MKHILYITTIMVLFAFSAFADQKIPAASAAAPAAVTAPAVVAAAPADKTVTGAVKSVSLADAAKGTKSEIVLTDATGQSVTLLVKATTTLYDANAQAITLDKIAAGSSINATYTVTVEGVDEAKSVKIVKS